MNTLDRHQAFWTYDDSEGEPAYYFAPSIRATGPYLKQIEVKAILDIAADGTLAGVELVYGKLPPPPSKRPNESEPRPAIFPSEWIQEESEK